ncbi:DUF11 domain-containing protein [Candidatus Saccharibacteria bacterium]|nr:DUF11 domain-containing protein [Candidatus Saccharibacteria bacterium]
MKKFVSFLKRHSKKIGLFVGVGSAVALGAIAASAWGPSRTTYTVDHPADHITFNSIVDNPHVGDEREFVSIKDASNTTGGGWRDSVTVEEGKEYLVRIYAHNNAASSLNLTAENTRVKAGVPTTTGTSVMITGFVSADNAQPTEVWDDIKLSSDKTFNVAYVPGSARIYNNGYAAGGNGQPLPDSIVTSAGAKIGYNGPDGKVPGCFQYDNYIYFKVKPQFAKPNTYKVEKSVRKSGTTDWQQSVAAEAGDTVDYLVRYANTGQARQEKVVVVDKLPEGMTLVANSTYLKNSNHPGNDFQPDNQTGIIDGGLSIGNHAAGGVSYVKFTAKVPETADLECGPNTLKNWAYGAPAGSEPATDDADVTVDKDCDKPEEPIYECTALQAVDLGNKNYRFTTTVRAENGATVNKYVYSFGDATEALNTTDASVEHQYTKPGQYVAKVAVMFDVNGEQKEVKDTRCETTITIPETPVTPPVTPPTTPPTTVTSIPSTGPVQVLAGIFGTSATAYGVMAWVGSRRALKSVK